MTPTRIQELLEILWEEVDGDDDLQKFVETYGDELDKDFLPAIAAVVRQAETEENENVARFFKQMGMAFSPLLLPVGARVRAVSDDAAERAAALVRKLSQEVRNQEDFVRFAETHLREFDDVFFAVLEQIIQEEKAAGNEGVARFLGQVGEALKGLEIAV